MIKAIFYARFHHEKGPIIAHQVPADAIFIAAADRARSGNDPRISSKPPSPSSLDFPLLSPYLIPPQALCNRILTLRSPTSRHLVVSHPVCIVNDAYPRNEFIFNFGVVLDDKERWLRKGLADAWNDVVQKVAVVLKGLEEEKQWLSKDEENVENHLTTAHESRIYALCEMVMEDLNSYGECMIPVDDAVTLSLRLFPKRPEATPVYPWHVPVLLVNTAALATDTWDLALQLLLPHIDGVNHISRIANLADADIDICCAAIRALVQHGCALLLDVFSFSASYAPTPEIVGLTEDDSAQDEARKYVMLAGTDRADWTKGDVVRLLCSLRQGVRLREWVLARTEELAGIDVRRLITFGVIRGFLYRVHTFAVLNGPMPHKHPKVGPYLRGNHAFDEICTTCQMSYDEVNAAVSDHEAQLIQK